MVRRKHRHTDIKSQYNVITKTRKEMTKDHSISVDSTEVLERTEATLTAHLDVSEP